MSGTSGPRVIQWLDKTGIHNDCEDFQAPYGLPYPPAEETLDSGRFLAVNCMLFVSDTGGGHPGILMVTNNSDGGGIGNMLGFARDADPALGTKIRPLQPNSIVLMVVHRVNPVFPASWPKYESFESLGVGGEGYEMPYKGTMQAIVPCQTPALTDLSPIIDFGGYNGFSGGPGYGFTLGDGTNFGWGIFMEDESVFGGSIGTVKLSDTSPHLLAIEIHNNDEITLWTDGVPEALGNNGSVGQGARLFQGFFGSKMGHSGVFDFHGGGADDDVYDTAYIKAMMVYIGNIDPALRLQYMQYLQNKWETPAF